MAQTVTDDRICSLKLQTDPAAVEAESTFLYALSEASYEVIDAGNQVARISFAPIAQLVRGIPL